MHAATAALKIDPATKIQEEADFPIKLLKALLIGRIPCIIKLSTPDKIATNKIGLDFFTAGTTDATNIAYSAMLIAIQISLGTRVVAKLPTIAPTPQAKYGNDITPRK